MVNETRYAVARPSPRSAICPMPKTWNTSRSTQNTPILTTATACSSALTGVGATIAAGSQACIGMIAALANPNR